MKPASLLLLLFFVMSQPTTTQGQNGTGSAAQKTNDPTDEELDKLKLDALKAAQRAEIAKQEATRAEEQRKKKESEKGPEVDQADKAKKEADAKKAQADADEATIKALKSKFNTDATITGPKGEVTVNGQFIETQIIARNVLDGLAKKIAEEHVSRISATKATFVMYDQASVEGIESYLYFKSQLDKHKSTLGNLIANAGSVKDKAEAALATATKAPIKTKDDAHHLFAFDPTTLPLAVLGIAQSAAQIAQLFKRDDSINTEDITLRVQDFVPMYVRAVQEKLQANKKDWTFYYPGDYPVNLYDDGGSDLHNLYNDVVGKAELAGGQLTDLEQLLERLQDYQSKRKPTEPDLLLEVNAVQTGADGLKSILKIQEGVVKQLTGDDNTSTLLMSRLMRAERIYTVLHKLMHPAPAGPMTASTVPNASVGLAQASSERVYTIKIELSSRGSNKITKSLWTSPKIRHSAGAWVTCIIYDEQGRMVYTANFGEYTPYVLSEDLKTTN